MSNAEANTEENTKPSSTSVILIIVVMLGLFAYLISGVSYDIGHENGRESERVVANLEIETLEARTQSSQMHVISVSGGSFTDYSILKGENGHEVEVSNYLLRELGYEGKMLAGRYINLISYRDTGRVIDIGPSKAPDPGWCPRMPSC